jgi:hypothetical protein
MDAATLTSRQLTAPTILAVALSDVRPHPLLDQLGITLPVNPDPIDCSLPSITADGILLDGIASVLAAKRAGQSDLTCFVHALSESEALSWILRRYRPYKGFNDFVRIQVALELEPEFRSKAQRNQSKAGRYKGSSNLTEADRIDVRSEIAEVAGVGVGNVTKVKQLLPRACRELVQALRSSDVRIHRAWLWRNQSHEEQRRLLDSYLDEKHLRITVAKLLAKKLIDRSREIQPRQFASRLLECADADPTAFQLTVMKMQGCHLIVTEDLLRTLEKQSDFSLCQIDADSNNS